MRNETIQVQANEGNSRQCGLLYHLLGLSSENEGITSLGDKVSEEQVLPCPLTNRSVCKMEVLMRLRVHLRYAEEFHGTKLYLMKDGPCGELVIAKPVELEWETYNINSWPEPTIVFQGPDAFDFMKGLANELASQGFVPDEVKERTSELTAVRYHLEDMRKIVFHKEGIST